MPEQFAEPKKYLLIPIIKNPYYRIGPKKWQDYYRQIQKTIDIARKLKNQGGGVTIILLSNFQPKGKPSEIQIYQEIFNKLAPELNIIAYRETNSTLEQVERSFKLKDEMGAKLVFISAWMQYPRILYLSHRKEAMYYGLFGMPQPIFAMIDLICIIFEPIVEFLGIGNSIRKFSISQREKGRIL